MTLSKILDLRASFLSPVKATEQGRLEALRENAGKVLEAMLQPSPQGRLVPEECLESSQIL